MIDPLRTRLCAALGLETTLMACLLHDGTSGDPAPPGALRGTAILIGDPTAPMEGWKMLEE